MDSKDIKQPMPRDGFDMSYVCRYESEIDRQVILHAMGHYIKEVLGSEDILFIKVPMKAINMAFKVDPKFPGEEIEFSVDHKHNNVVRYTETVGEELPPLWSALVNEATGIHIITTIEPCKFIISKHDLDKFCGVMADVKIAPGQYNHGELDSVHWNSVTDVLKRDVQFFITGKKFFDSRGMSYSRSYLLHGPPGNGKTTTIKAIAKFLNTKPESFDFSAQMQSPDSQFIGWVLGDSERIAREEERSGHSSAAMAAGSPIDEDDEGKATPIRLLVMEDIDRLFPKEGPKQTAVSLQAILQALDGAVERRNMIVIATANEPKNIDQQVLARPGRFDKQVFYEQPNKEHAFEFMKALFEGEEVSDEVLRQACEKLSGHSYAFHKELFATAASYTIERTSTIISDEDVKKGLADLISHIDNVALRSERPTFGFAE